MKKIVLLAGVLMLAPAQSIWGIEYGQLKASLPPNADSRATETVVLAQGDVFTFLGPVLGVEYVFLGVDLEVQGETRSSNLPLVAASAGTTKPLYEPLHIVGPAVIYLKNMDPSSPQWACLSYKLERAAELQYKQVNIVSLPAETVGEGTHEIVVEASDDLRTWTPVHSSPIAGDRGFFRTRVVRVSE